MTLQKSLIPNFIGLSVQGDLGPWTFYTAKNGAIVFYPQAPPLQPASVAQRGVRNRMVRASWAWRGLPSDQQKNWRVACKRLGLECVGFGLWFYWYAKRDVATLVTIERQSGLPLLTPEAKNV